MRLCECLQSRHDFKKFSENEAPLTILRSWFNKLLPQGGTTLFYSALQIKVDDTSFFSVSLKEIVELVTFLYYYVFF